MKALMNLTIVVMLFLTACTTSRTAPETIADVTRRVESKDFTIEADYVYPQRMKPRILTPGYELRIKNDSAFAYLPYFGVAHVAPLDPSDAGIKFSEPIFDYRISPNKKNNGWDIRFKVRNRQLVYEIVMDLFNNGKATFSVGSYDRDLIRYNGEMKR